MARTADIGYLAGIIDGEGCIRLKKGRPSITVKMTDLDVIEKCQQIAGVGNVNGPYDPANGNKVQWTWNVNKQSDAASILMTIFPLVSERRKQKIEEVLHIWRGRPLMEQKECGTWAAYCRHHRNNEPPCEPCNGAMRAYNHRNRVI